MGQSVSIPTAASVAGMQEAVKVKTIPWYVWCFFAATISAVIGGVWDISWHKSIGRDSFWTPAHMMIYLCGVLAGLGSAYLILSTTWNQRAPLRDTSVTMWGFRGPLGAFIGAWGGMAMLVSAPFDDWWHSAYGLDVKVLSPPHVVLILGILAIRLAALVLTLGEMNRAEGDLRRSLHRLFLFIAAMWLGGGMGMFLERISRNFMHSASFYMIIAALPVLFLIAVNHASGARWAATKTAAILACTSLLFLWIFPLFPAEPKLGPVYHKITHMIPASDFPLLILFPAIALDFVRQRTRQWSLWRSALVAGPVFLAVFVAVQWPFANFLISPAARNWFFGTHYVPFFVSPEADYVRGVFTQVEATAVEFLAKMSLAFVLSVVSARVGLGWGEWMTRVRR